MSQFTRFWNGLGEAATAAFLASTASVGERWAPEGSEIMSSTHCAKEKSAAAAAAEGAARALVERAARKARRRGEACIVVRVG